MTARRLPPGALGPPPPARPSWTLWVRRDLRWGWTPKRLCWSEDRARAAATKILGAEWIVTTGFAIPGPETVPMGGRMPSMPGRA